MNFAATVPISTFMCRLAIYVFPRSICLFCCRKYMDRSWEYINRSQTHECVNWDWGRAIPRKGILNGILLAVQGLWMGWICTCRLIPYLPTLLTPGPRALMPRVRWNPASCLFRLSLYWSLVRLLLFGWWVKFIVVYTVGHSIFPAFPYPCFQRVFNAL